MVHPALLPENFSKLHPYLRVSAAVQGTVKNLADLCANIITLPEDQRVLILPVFFLHLNPSLIPHVDLLGADHMSDRLRTVIERAIESLDGLADLSGNSSIPIAVDGLVYLSGSIPIAAAPELWTRVWPWAEFLHMYWDILPGVRRFDKIGICMRIATILTMLGLPSNAAEFIGQTHGVRTIIAQAWAHTLRDDVLSSRQASPEQVNWALGFLATNLQDSANLGEILDGVCGSHNLVSVLRKHIAHACAFLPSPMAIASLTGGFSFVESLSKHHPVFQSLAGGITESISTTLATISHPTRSTVAASSTVVLCLFLLERYLRVFPSTTYVWLARALEADLLRFMVSFSISPQDSRTADAMSLAMKQLLTGVLINGLTSHRVINRMEAALLDAVEAAQSAEESESRIQVSDADRSVLRACDNMKCGVLKPKNELKCCSTCLSVLYCSRECQVMDWRDAHRDECHSWLFSRSRRSTLPSRERAFVHALLAADYPRMRPELARRTIDFVAEFPTQPFYAAWDYRAPYTQPNLEIRPRDHFESDNSVAQLDELGWDLHWQRMSRSAGRMRMNVVILAQGCFVIPTRSSTAAFRDGLVRIGDGIHGRGRVEGAAEQIDELIQDLIHCWLWATRRFLLATGDHLLLAMVLTRRQSKAISRWLPNEILFEIILSVSSKEASARHRGPILYREAALELYKSLPLLCRPLGISKVDGSARTSIRRLVSLARRNRITEGDLPDLLMIMFLRWHLSLSAIHSYNRSASRGWTAPACRIPLPNLQRFQGPAEFILPLDACTMREVYLFWELTDSVERNSVILALRALTRSDVMCSNDGVGDDFEDILLHLDLSAVSPELAVQLIADVKTSLPHLKGLRFLSIEDVDSDYYNYDEEFDITELGALGISVRLCVVVDFASPVEDCLELAGRFSELRRFQGYPKVGRRTICEYLLLTCWVLAEEERGQGYQSITHLCKTMWMAIVHPHLLSDGGSPSAASIMSAYVYSKPQPGSEKENQSVPVRIPHTWDVENR
ncbi:hypothetical protein DFH06DRAFT_1135655 [Mycena polygramma]|nr:hypothetical protein DFH06DRAFT_1135655 [Mycena polygramma]